VFFLVIRFLFLIISCYTCDFSYTAYKLILCEFPP